MSEIVVPHDVPQRMHEALQTTVRQCSDTRNVVGTDLSLRCIPLFTVCTIQDDVEINEIQVAESFVGTRRAEGIQRRVESLQLRLEEQNTPGREVFGYDDLAVGSFTIETLWDDNRSRLNELSGYTPQRLIIVAILVGREFDMSTVDKLGFGPTKLDR